MIRQAFTAAWNSRDPAKVAELFVADGVRRVMGQPPLVHRGKTAIADHVSDQFAALPDAILDLRSDGISSAGLTVLEWTMRGSIPGRNRRALTLHGVSVLLIERGLILEERAYVGSSQPFAVR